MQFNEKFWLCAAGINGFLAIVMGAVAAHAIADAHLSALAEKASLYQLIHAVVLLWLADRQGRILNLVRWVFLAGIILFCGTLYLKALAILPVATKLAPLGGISFMVGRFLIASAEGKKE